MGFQWTAIVLVLYSEIAVIGLLLLPFVSARRFVYIQILIYIIVIKDLQTEDFLVTLYSFNQAVALLALLALSRKILISLFGQYVFPIVRSDSKYCNS